MSESTASPDASPQPGWQPIATAPRDGSRFLGAWTHRLYGWLWSSARFHGGDAAYPDGYFVMEDGGEPTHWLPLPAPPGAPPLRSDGGAPSSPIALTEEQQEAVKSWAADDRLWTTQETVEFNLRTFARVVLSIDRSQPIQLRQNNSPQPIAMRADGGAQPDLQPAYRIDVEQEDDGRWFASWTSSDGQEGGCAEYAATLVGALAELCATLLKVDEDKAVEAREPAASLPVSSPAPADETPSIVGVRWKANGEVYIDCLEHFNRTAHLDGEYERLFAKDAVGLVCDVCQEPLRGDGYQAVASPVPAERARLTALLEVLVSRGTACTMNNPKTCRVKHPDNPRPWCSPCIIAELQEALLSPSEAPKVPER